MNELYLPFDTELISVTVRRDCDAPWYSVGMKDEVKDWCIQYLTKLAIVGIDTSETAPGYFVVFACTNDLLHFKLRWI